MKFKEIKNSICNLPNPINIHWCKVVGEMKTVTIKCTGKDCLICKEIKKEKE